MADDFLTAIGKLLGLTPQPAIAGPANPAQAAPAAGAPGGAAPSGGGLTAFLANPLTEAALGAAAGYLGQPRGSGIMRRLGQGGLAGLNEFSSAEAAQARLPMQQAELQKARAEAEKAKADAASATQKTAAYAGHPEYYTPGATMWAQNVKASNAATAAGWLDTVRTRDPGRYKDAISLATAAGSNTTKPVSSKDLTEALYGSDEMRAKIGEIGARTTAESARAGYETAAAKRIAASPPIGASRAGKARDPILEADRLHRMYISVSTDHLTGLPIDGFPDEESWTANELRKLGLSDRSGASTGAPPPSRRTATPTTIAPSSSTGTPTSFSIPEFGGTGVLVGHDEKGRGLYRFPDGKTRAKNPS